VQIDGLSAHGDYEEILAWLKHLKHAPNCTFITHGEPAAADHLRQKLERDLKWRCEVPEHLSCYQIEGETLTSLRSQIL
jgi:metallo-beta-lactamase family protein